VEANTYVGEGQNLTNTSEGVDTNGQPFKLVARHIYDGTPHPTIGNSSYDSTSFTRIGNAINWVRFKQGKIVEVGHGVIVPGKTYTITDEGIPASGQQYHNVLVLERQ
jgi:hypothetical protein